MVLPSGVVYPINCTVSPWEVVLVANMLPSALTVKVPVDVTAMKTVPPTEYDATLLKVPPLPVALGMIVDRPAPAMGTWPGTKPFSVKT